MAIQHKKLAAWITQGTVAFQKSSGKGASETRSYTWALRRAFWVDPLEKLPLLKLLEIPVWLTLSLALIYLGDSMAANRPLADDLYPWLISQMAYLGGSSFLWMDLTAPDRTFAMPLLVFAARVVTQSVVVTHEPDLRQSVKSVPFWLLPAGLAALAAALPSGVALCWIASWAVALAVYAFVNLFYVLPPNKFVVRAPR